MNYLVELEKHINKHFGATDKIFLWGRLSCDWFGVKGEETTIQVLPIATKLKIICINNPENVDPVCCCQYQDMNVYIPLSCLQLC